MSEVSFPMASAAHGRSTTQSASSVHVSPLARWALAATDAASSQIKKCHKDRERLFVSHGSANSEKDE